MTDTRTLLSIDQGTTSSRAILFSASGDVIKVDQSEFEQHYPANGWVEHDPEEIWSTTAAACREVCEAAAVPPEAIGITNQRETVVVWERTTGKPIYPAIVWQDRRTAERCEQLRADGHESLVTQKTGLLLDPYFSATKIAWILDNVEGARARAEAGELAAGTIDTFLIWRLTQGQVHATDATNASRTALFNIHSQQWDSALLELFEVPSALLPEVLDCVDDFGTSHADSIGIEIPIRGVAGDQQSAAFGQACFSAGMVKSTYGTGCFALLNTGTTAIASQNRMLTTVAYRLDGVTHYALEGSIFIAGAAVQWLRDGIGLIHSSHETEALAKRSREDSKVYVVPAFTGLGAPHWDPHARGAIFGLTRDSGPAEIAKATLESVCLQTNDLLSAMSDDAEKPVSAIRVDGGMAANDWLLNALAAICDVRVQRPKVIETTALGAAYLAGLGAGIYSSLNDIEARWVRDAEFDTNMPGEKRTALIDGWQSAVQQVRSHGSR